LIGLNCTLDLEEREMATTIGFETVQDYLSGLAALGTISNSPHKSFWKVKIVGGVTTPITYDDFINGTIPHVTYGGFSGAAAQPIPIIWKGAPLLSPLFLILVESTGFAGIDQMIPNGGAHLTDAGLTITVPDRTTTPPGTNTVTGAQVLQDLEVWLKNGFPKDPTAIP
jgi:hypothetical protein